MLWAATIFCVDVKGIILKTKTKDHNLCINNENILQEEHMIVCDSHLKHDLFSFSEKNQKIYCIVPKKKSQGNKQKKEKRDV